MSANTETLGGLLRAWRDRLSPADLGITPGPHRRTPGLRREELAALAGLSVDYVVRLEQDRAHHPSPQVVSAIARALHLNTVERDHLFRVAGALPPADGRVSTHLPAERCGEHDRPASPLCQGEMIRFTSVSQRFRASVAQWKE